MRATHSCRTFCERLITPRLYSRLIDDSVQGNFIFDPATHRDFLGAILATGVLRSKVGDVVLLNDNGAQFLTIPHLVDHFQIALKQVRSVPVTCSAIPIDQLRVKPPKMDTFSTVESSTRLDAVASSGE